MKTPANHPWKSSGKRKVKAECLACKQVFERDPESDRNTCSGPCQKAYRRVKVMAHVVRGGFR